MYTIVHKQEMKVTEGHRIVATHIEGFTAHGIMKGR